MMMGLDDFGRLTAGLLGLKAWNAVVGDNRSVTVDFGEQLVDDPPSGEYHLWLCGCSWRLERGASMVVGCADGEARVQDGVALLNGQRLLGIEVDPVSLSAVFRLTGRLVVRTFSIFSKEAEHWVLRLPDERWIVAGPGWTMAAES